MADIHESFLKLKNYCERKGYLGWDPYDGLNSRLFRTVPGLKNSRIARLAWIQFFKRSPVNLRRLLLVPQEYNPKGIALFLNGYCHLYHINPSEEYLENINQLGHILLSLKSDGYSGACWGYNFDWQARAFFQPKYTPTVVASTFAAYALLDAWEITCNRAFRDTALSTADFILQDLNRTVDQDGDFAFSYSPEDQTQVFNASLLGSRMLARAYSVTGRDENLQAARKSVAYCCKHQKEDGSWPYGTLPWHQWIDNFHTGYNLECIAVYQKYSGDDSFSENLEKGFDYYINTFFTDKGIPKYYNDSIYPVDVHTTAQLLITLHRLGKYAEHRDLAQRVLRWTIDHMQGSDGHFFYQKHKNYVIRTPYMRWTQAWMFYGMSSSLSNF
ncbi:MAG TPA: delta-aminolevulinic acid dehydratase [Bacteroidales bacterium]|nr:delta-aminolevulinic acid dehydratase [Bacteroidales bacterium]